MQEFAHADEPHFIFKVVETEIRVVAFSVMEKISAPFEINLELASEEEIDFEKVIELAPDSEMAEQSETYLKLLP